MKLSRARPLQSFDHLRTERFCLVQLCPENSHIFSLAAHGSVLIKLKNRIVGELLSHKSR